MAPCYDCGWKKIEIEHFHEEEHSYCEFEVYGSKLILCDFCAFDFSSYSPEYLGFPKGKKLGYGTVGFGLLRDLTTVECALGKDKFCNTCEARLKFLEALQEMRSRQDEKEG